jgi:hypothetical protein
VGIVFRYLDSILPSIYDCFPQYWSLIWTGLRLSDQPQSFSIEAKADIVLVAGKDGGRWKIKHINVLPSNYSVLKLDRERRAHEFLDGCDLLGMLAPSLK